MSTEMKKLIIGGTEYEIVDDAGRTRITALEQGGGSGTGLTQTEKNLLLTLLEKAAYAENDANTAYTALSNLWTGYSIMWSGTGYTKSNSAVAVSAGSSFTSTITANTGFNITAVTVTMGGNTVQGAWSSGTVTIPNVTGDIVITVTTAQASVSSISAVYTQSGTVYDTASLDSLKSDLVVTATFTDSSTGVIDAAGYTLSGTLTEGTSTITVSYAGKTATFDVTVTVGVPSGYTKVDYLTSAVHGTPANTHLSTTPYIKTGWPSVDTDIKDYKVTIEFMPLFDQINSCPFGGRNGTTAGATTLGTVLTYDVTNSNSSLNYGNKSGQSAALVTYIGNAFSAGTKCKFVLDAGDIYLDDVLTAQSGAETAVQLAAYPWALFARNNNGSYTVNNTSGGNLAPFIGRVYGFSIQDGNGNYVLRYIPCFRNSDNVYGMYDTVSRVFKTSAITTGFSGGND